MPLHGLPEAILRTHCRGALEALELWLRTIIDRQLTEQYGADFLDAKRPDDSLVVNTKIRARLAGRLKANPSRYSREIDAAELDDGIAVVCNPELWKHFAAPLRRAFPDGREEARTFLLRLVPPRNKLAHANPISVREAEQVICYSNDVIDSLKGYFAEAGAGGEYNVPTVVRMSDNLGNVFHASQIVRNSTGSGGVPIALGPLRPGDVISVEVEIDASFPEDSYKIEWIVPRYEGPQLAGHKLVLPVTNRYVNPAFTFFCNVTSNKDWHRLGSYDDSVFLTYKILPPISA